MESPVLAVGVAVAAFAATHVDDLFVLVAFLAEPAARPARVFLGQYLGIAALYAAGIAGSLVAVALPAAYVGLLGLAPIAIGAWKLRARASGGPDGRPAMALRRASGEVFAVAAVTVANGGDDVGVYAPLFATRPAGEVALFGLVFTAMTALWCLAAHRLLSHPAAGAPIRRHARRIVPLVLIALGCFILYEADSHELLRR
jgi:cadmium resistance protein CadD (predicted permease)